jgi:hypothetical protein
MVALAALTRRMSHSNIGCCTAITQKDATAHAVYICFCKHVSLFLYYRFIQDYSLYSLFDLANEHQEIDGGLLQCCQKRCQNNRQTKRSKEIACFRMLAGPDHLFAPVTMFFLTKMSPTNTQLRLNVDCYQ